MKKVVCFIQVVFVLSLFVEVIAFDEPMYFRNFRFHSHVSKHRKNLDLVEEHGKDKFYKKLREDLSIGGAKLEKIVYGFYEDYFYSVLITSKGFSNGDALLKAMVQKYGNPTRPNRYMKKYFWLGNDVNIIYEYHEILRTTEITYMYKPIMNRIARDDRREAVNATNDF